MLKTVGREAARVFAGLAGAAILAAAFGAAAIPHDRGFWNHLGAMGTWLWRALSLDFGKNADGDALAQVGPALGASVSLLAPALLLAFLIGIPLGVLLADRRTRAYVAPPMLLGRAVPVFCGGLLIAALAMASTPSVIPGHASLDAALSSRDGPAAATALLSLAPLILPIALTAAGALALAIATAMSNALAEPYRESLHRLGMTQRDVLRHYVARRTLATAFASLGNVALAAIGATAVVERLFDWPGAGALFMDAASGGDWSVIAVLVLVIATARIVADFIASLASTAITGAAP